MSPRASVIIPGYYSFDVLSTCLKSLENQSEKNFEIIFVNSSPETETEAIVRRDFPWVRFYQHPRRLLMHAARNKGVSMARSSLLLFTDPDVELHPRWVEKMVRAFAGGAQYLVGEMGCKEESWLELGIHLVKYHEHLPGGRSVPRIAPTASAGISARLFAEAGGFAGEKVCADAMLSWKLQDLGIPIQRITGVPVRHTHAGRLTGFLRERCARGDEFMDELVKFEGWTLPAITLRALLFPAALISVIVRAGRHCLAAGWFGRYLWTLPIQVLGQIAWCYGEMRAQTARIRGAR